MKWLAERYLKLSGWKFVGVVPDQAKFIVIGAPHTTNWDFVLYLGAVRHWGLQTRYLGKHTLFAWPFGWVFRRWGGIAVDRRQAGGVIGQVARKFAEEDELALVIAPEGTRKAAPSWKSGFLLIAKETGAPIVPAGVDYARKEVTLGEPIWHVGPAAETMDRIRSFYEGVIGKHPGGMGPIRVGEEG
jgi:1-acyl-sn-glycerol-3-phosphate acyltransferase